MTSFRLGVNTGFATDRFVQPDDWIAIVGETLGVRIVQFTADLLYPRYGRDVVDAQIEAINAGVARALEAGGAESVSLALEFSFRERFPAEARVIGDLRESVGYWREHVKE